MSRRPLVPLFGLLVALALAGCEGSPVPLSDPPSVAVDPALTGLWEFVDADGEAGDRALVLAFNEHEYLVEYREATRDDDGTVTFDDLERIRMFVTDVDGRSFLNLTCIGCDDPGWLFVELEGPDGDVVRVVPINDDLYDRLEDDARPDDVLAALRGLLAEPDALEDAGVFRRIED